MSDPQLAALAKHCRHMAVEADGKELKLWLQIADEIDAYLDGELDQPSLEEA